MRKEAAPPTATAAASAAAAVEKQKEKKMPKLEKHASHIHTSFPYRRQHNVRVLSHMRTRYFSEGSVQHPPSYSFRRRVRGEKNTEQNQQCSSSSSSSSSSSRKAGVLSDSNTRGCEGQSSLVRATAKPIHLREHAEHDMIC